MAPPPRAEATLLGEVTGALVQQLIMAQAQADYASAQLGEVYAQHPVLVRFPVPSLAMREIEVTLPVAMEGLHFTSTSGVETAPGTPELPAGVQVHYTPSQLQGVAPGLIATIKLTMKSEPKRLVNIDGKTVLVP